MKHVKKTHCPWCDEKLPTDFYEKRNLKRSKSVKESLNLRKEQGLNVGRPRTADYSSIRNLRMMGLTIREICRKLKVSQGSVQRAIESLS